MESAVEFVSEQKPFVHSLIRLCRFWNKSLYINKNLSGRITVIQLLAIHAGQVQDGITDSKWPMVDAFMGFLRLMSELDKVNICFGKSKPAISMSPPLLLDPINPYVNHLSHWPKEANELFRKFARETLL